MRALTTTQQSGVPVCRVVLRLAHRQRHYHEQYHHPSHIIEDREGIVFVRFPVHRSAILLTSIEVLKQCNHVIGNPTVMMTVIVLLARSSVAQLCGSQAATDAAVHLSATNATASAAVNAAIYVPATHVPAACTAEHLSTAGL